MPLRDHFHPPLTKRHSWDALFGGWPAMIVSQLHGFLPSDYYSAPYTHLGRHIDLEPTIIFKDDHADLLDTDEYSVRVYDVNRERRLVAAIELVSPTNKDRPESKQAFVSKCAALLREEVSVMIVDVVTSRAGNLFADLLTTIGSHELHDAMSSSNIYAGACRLNAPGQRRRLQAWHESLAVGKPLPTLPLWLSSSLELPLDLEVSYEETCRILRMS